jgi:ppGpp synthetase/RelA/SpoT-type nucleotidyltranferase
MKKTLGVRQLQLIDDLVQCFVSNPEPFKRTLNSIQGYIDSSEKLQALIHSVKFRIKDPEHLRDKLIRKALEAKQNRKQFSITSKNLFNKINDLAGYRIIHLHTKQFEEIHAELTRIFNEQQWLIVEGPSAKTWDDESREYFRKIGIKVSKSPNLYTSVHYIIKPNSTSKITCEIQVRTLMEEVWGEVDHSINYPHKSEILSVREQIKALARATSSCSRLVDSIFSTHTDNSSKISNPQKIKRKTKL